MPNVPSSVSAAPLLPKRKRIVATPAFLYGGVIFMGAIGACLRYFLGAVLPESPIPFGTLAINLFGCYIIYVIYQWLGRRVHLPHAIVRSLGVGLVGAFTTLSAFSTESLAYLEQGAIGLFALYGLLTVIGTFAASLLGWATVAGLEHHRMHKLTGELHEHDSAGEA
ncbi:MAG: fluoride efflux transporter FluC [Eggerthellaceae bacterium]|jgi:CrcB protein